MSTRVSFVLAGLLCVAACGPARVARSAMPPSPDLPKLRHLLAIGMTGDAAKRQRMEDAIVEQVTARSDGIDVVPSYAVAADILQQVKKSGYPEGTQPTTHDFDSAVVCRVADPRHRNVYLPGRTLTPPEYYRTIWDYYRYWQPIVFDKDYDEVNRNGFVETEVYSLPDGELIYSALSRRMDPKSAADLMTAVGITVTRDLQARGLVAAK